jgi:hypothetical protein
MQHHSIRKKLALNFSYHRRSVSVVRWRNYVAGTVLPEVIPVQLPVLYKPEYRNIWEWNPLSGVVYSGKQRLGYGIPCPAL